MLKNIATNSILGVVYAVKFSTEDLPNIEYQKIVGVVYHGIVIPEKLIAKICFPFKLDETFIQKIGEELLFKVSGNLLTKTL